MLWQWWIIDGSKETVNEWVSSSSLWTAARDMNEQLCFLFTLSLRLWYFNWRDGGSTHTQIYIHTQTPRGNWVTLPPGTGMNGIKLAWHWRGERESRGQSGGAVCQQLHNSGCHYALSSYTRRKRGGHYHHIITAMLREQLSGTLLCLQPV